MQARGRRESDRATRNRSLQGPERNPDSINGNGGSHANGHEIETTISTEEDAYWRAHYSSRPYSRVGVAYETLQPAYRYGWESRASQEGKKWKEVEKGLRAGWNTARGNSKLPWDDARPATHDAYERGSRDQDRMDDDGASRDQGGNVARERR